MDKDRIVTHPEEWDRALKELAKKKHTTVKGLFTITMEKELENCGYFKNENNTTNCNKA